MVIIPADSCNTQKHTVWLITKTRKNNQLQKKKQTQKNQPDCYYDNNWIGDDDRRRV